MSSDFPAKLGGALSDLKKVLDVCRQPDFPENVDHSYGDKFTVAEGVVNAAALSIGCTLSTLGLAGEALKTAQDLSEERSVTLSFRREETCTFDKKETREEEAPTKHVRESTGVFGTTTTTHKVVRTITDYHWNFSYSYELFLYPGTSIDENPIVLSTGERVSRVTTGTDKSPYPPKHIPEPIELNLGWFLKTFGTNVVVARQDERCRTPSRNPEVEGAVRFAKRLAVFSRGCTGYFEQMFSRQTGHGLDMGVMSSSTFTPVLPVMEKDAEQITLGREETDTLLAEERKQLGARLDVVRSTLPSKVRLITSEEGCLVVTLKHLNDIAQSLMSSVAYLERLIRTQLIAALGKTVSAADFEAYMEFHFRKLFNPEYQPSPFAFNVENTAATLKLDPEGVVSLLKEVAGEKSKEIMCLSRKMNEGLDMKFELSAASQVTLHGSCYVHSYIRSDFGAMHSPPLTEDSICGAVLPAKPSYLLQARARQFSSFVLLLGRIGGSALFLPEHAMIIKNKDDLSIPLFLDTIPSPAEFKKATQSMSPEQIAFSKAYRAMQLESTLFGIATVPIKPQMEQLLKLPEGSLKKEIRLGEDLLTLFLDYNVPSDLLGFRAEDVVVKHSDPMETVSSGTSKQPEHSPAVDQVKQNVAAMLQMIQEEKKEELTAATAALVRGSSVSSSDIGTGAGWGDDGGEPLLCELDCLGAPCGESMALADEDLEGELEACLEECEQEWDDDDDDGDYEEQCAPEPDTAPIETTIEPNETKEDTPKPDPEQIPEETPPTPSAPSLARDLTAIPKELEARFDSLGKTGAAVRPTTIKFECNNEPSLWTQKFKKNLLSREETKVLGVDEQKAAKVQAFDLLDALTKSGCIPVEGAAVHVVVATTHCFEKTLMDTLTIDNVNPIEKAELTSLHIASVLHETAPLLLAAEAQKERLSHPLSIEGAN